MLDDDEDHVRAEHRQVAVRQVDDPHHAEHEREPARKHRIEGAEKDALEDRVDDGQAGRLSPKYAPTTRSRSSEAASPSRTTRPSSMQITRPATFNARVRSCSTSKTVAPSLITSPSER